MEAHPRSYGAFTLRESERENDITFRCLVVKFNVLFTLSVGKKSL